MMLRVRSWVKSGDLNCNTRQTLENNFENWTQISPTSNAKNNCNRINSKQTSLVKHFLSNFDWIFVVPGFSEGKLSLGLLFSAKKECSFCEADLDFRTRRGLKIVNKKLFKKRVLKLGLTLTKWLLKLSDETVKNSHSLLCLSQNFDDLVFDLTQNRNFWILFTFC